VLILAPIAATLLQLGIFRQREYSADATALAWWASLRVDQRPAKNWGL